MQINGKLSNQEKEVNIGEKNVEKGAIRSPWTSLGQQLLTSISEFPALEFWIYGYIPIILIPTLNQKIIPVSVPYMDKIDIFNHSLYESHI